MEVHPQGEAQQKSRIKCVLLLIKTVLETILRAYFVFRKE